MSRRRVLAGVVLAVLLLPALVVTVSRLTGWTGRLGIVATSFTPLALLPYAVALAVLVGLLVRGHRDRVVVGLAAAVVVLVGLHAWWLAPLYVGDAPEPAAGAPRVTVMGSNVEFGQGDAAVVVDEVRRRGVDVLVVGEITPRFLAAADAAGLGEVLPHRAGRPDEAASGTMVFSSTPLDVVDDTVDTYFDSLVVRTQDLTVLATHPAPPTFAAEWRHDARVLLDTARRHEVDLVVGDLNATPDHPTLRDLAAAGWRDAVDLTDAGLAPTWPVGGSAYLPVPVPVVAIDHVLARDSVAVTASDRLEVPGSDHLAVVATVARAASGPDRLPPAR